MLVFSSHGRAEFVTKHAKYSVTCIDTSGYRHTYLVKDYVKQHDLPDTPGLKMFKIGVKVPHMFTSLRGKIVVSSKSQDVHAEKIAILREQLAREKENLKNMS